MVVLNLPWVVRLDVYINYKNGGWRMRECSVGSESLIIASVSIAVLLLPGKAKAESCDLILLALSQENSLTRVKASEDALVTHYRYGLNTSLSVSCAFDKPSLEVSWDGLEPDQSFYELVGRVGGLVSSQSRTDVVKSSRLCREQALKDDSEIATIEREGLAIECQAFKRDGGGTTIMVFAE